MWDMGGQMGKEIWIGQNISGYAQHIMSAAPDPCPTMALLMFLLSHRRWYGDWKDWTQTPIKWLAKKWRMHFYRVKAALTWLERQKMVLSCQTNFDAARSGRAGWYKVIAGGIRQQKAQESVATRKRGRQEILKATPKAEGDVPTVPVVFWSSSTAEVVWESRPAEYAASLEHCHRCGGTFDPIIGRHPDHPTICIQCYILEIAVTGKPLTIELDLGTYEWDAETVDRFLESVL